MQLNKKFKNNVLLATLFVWLIFALSSLFSYSFTFAKSSYELASSSVNSYQIGDLVVCNDFDGIAIPYKSYLLNMDFYKPNRDRNILMFIDWILMPAEDRLLYIANKEGHLVSFLQTKERAKDKVEAQEIIQTMVSELSGEQVNLKGINAALIRKDNNYTYTLPLEGIVITATTRSMVDTINFGLKRNGVCHSN